MTLCWSLPSEQFSIHNPFLTLIYFEKSLFCYYIQTNLNWMPKRFLEVVFPTNRSGFRPSGQESGISIKDNNVLFTEHQGNCIKIYRFWLSKQFDLIWCAPNRTILKTYHFSRLPWILIQIPISRLEEEEFMY